MEKAVEGVCMLSLCRAKSRSSFSLKIYFFKRSIFCSHTAKFFASFFVRHSATVFSGTACISGIKKLICASAALDAII